MFSSVLAYIFKSGNRYKTLSILLLCIVAATVLSLKGYNYISAFANGLDAQGQATYRFDIVVYGGTPSGIMAAIAAAREGASVAILEPGSHPGGLITSGLCFSDEGNSKIIGGLANEFFAKVGQHYGKAVGYTFEPHVAEEIIAKMIGESGVNVFYRHILKENGGVRKTGTKITGVITEDGDQFFAKEFIDCSYEGDLMAMSGVSYTYGREGVGQYSESLAGVRPFTGAHNFKYPTKAFSDNGSLLPEILDDAVGEFGQGDKKIQAYNFRLCLTYDTGNQAPFIRPDNYNPARYELLLKWLYQVKAAENHRRLGIRDILFLGDLPNRKFDANNTGPFSSDYIGGSWHYPEGDYETRQNIIAEHKSYLQGLLHFAATDLRVPSELRSDMQRWGLAKDEFADNSHWPYQLYIREGRRMTGDFVMTQKDLMTDMVKPDSIGMGSYNIDSHNTQRCVTVNGFVLNEGDVQIPVSPYQIPYRIILPKKSEAGNLTVPVCMSASHIAYASLRMEPQYMILGQAAGIAAKMAIDGNCSVQDINVEILKLKLKDKKAILE